MENLSIIIFDTLLTVLLFVFVSILLLTIGGWAYSVHCKLSETARPAFLEGFLWKCFSILFFTGCMLGFFYQVCYIGFENTQPIDGIPPCIVQFHCFCPYNAEHRDYIMSILDAMDYCC